MKRPNEEVINGNGRKKYGKEPWRGSTKPGACHYGREKYEQERVGKKVPQEQRQNKSHCNGQHPHPVAPDQGFDPSRDPSCLALDFACSDKESAMLTFICSGSNSLNQGSAKIGRSSRFWENISHSSVYPDYWLQKPIASSPCRCAWGHSRAPPVKYLRPHRSLRIINNSDREYTAATGDIPNRHPDSEDVRLWR